MLFLTMSACSPMTLLTLMRAMTLLMVITKASTYGLVMFTVGQASLGPRTNAALNCLDLVDVSFKALKLKVAACSNFEDIYTSMCDCDYFHYVHAYGGSDPRCDESDIQLLTRGEQLQNVSRSCFSTKSSSSAQVWLLC